MDRPKPKKDNSGVTLLEVIIAVSIFSIAAVVLLQGFVTSGKINKKSNLYLEATSTAQNIMEEIKAKDFEEVALAFNYPVSDPTTGESRFSFLNGIKNAGAEIKELIPVDAEKKIFRDVNPDAEAGDPDSSSILLKDTEDKGMVYVLNPKASSKYYFQMNGIKNNHETFDALIEFDGVDGDKDDKVNEGKYKGSKTGDKKNDAEIPNIAKLDYKENVFLIMQEDKNSSADGSTSEYDTIQNLIVQQLYNAAQSEWTEKNFAYDPETSPPEEAPGPEPQLEDWDHNEVSAAAKRTLTIDITQGGASVKYTYSVDLGDYAKNDTKHDYGNKLKPEDLVTSLEDYPLGGKKGLKGIYLFYYPNYNSTDKNNTLDNIIINNLENTKVNLYVVKEQASDDVLKEKKINLRNAEDNYRMKLEVHEKPEEISTKKIVGAINLRTNLNYNLAEEILKRAEISLYNWQMQFSYYWKEGMLPIKVPNESKQRIKDLVDYSGLDNKDVKDRIYKVTVTVYKHAGEDETAFMKKNEVVTLDGSKED